MMSLLALALAASPLWAQTKGLGPLEPLPAPAPLVGQGSGGAPAPAVEALPAQALLTDGANLASPLRSLFSEDEALAADLGARIAASPLGPAIRDWEGGLETALGPLFDNVARTKGAEPTVYRGWLAGSDEAREERQALGSMLRHHTSHRAETWTYLFRDHPLWKEPLEAFLDRKIAERRADKRLELQSVGAGYGVEGYSLAITVERALRRNGEDPSNWDVRIPVYDVSLVSLLSAGAGAYRVEPKDRETFEAIGAAPYFDKIEGGLLRLKAPLRDWIRPVFADLNQPQQHPIVTSARPDAVFANYLLFHLRLHPAAALADHWLQGRWSPHGFLSMAQTIVAEVGGSGRAPAKLGSEMPLLDRFGLSVGVIGTAWHGDSFRPSASWLDNLWLRRFPETREAVRLGGTVARSLRRDPFANVEADAKTVELLESLGSKVELTTDEIAIGRAEDGTLVLNAGWLVAGPDAAARRSRLAQILARGPPERRDGEVRPISGRTLEGATLRVEKEDGRAYLRWLDGKLVPVSDAFRDDNAAKPAPAPSAPNADAGPRIPRGVKGLF